MAGVYIGHRSACEQTWPVKIVTMFGFFPKEWEKYLASGMCGAIRPTFVTERCIQTDDTTLNSVYVFEAKRTSNMLSTINGKKDCLEVIQRY
jgi:hypothetical protein